MSQPTLTENEVRELRDAIYGPCENESWEQVKANWMKTENIRWLQQNQWKKNEQAG